MAAILIIGGGIGGLAAAIAMQRRGLDAHVFEAAPELRAVGAGIWMPPNAMSVLAALDLAEPVVASGLVLERLEVRDLRAGALQVMDGAAMASRTGFPSVAIRRSALQRILASALRPGSLHLGRHMVRFRCRADGVQAHFADGSAADGQLLVGADGIHSTVRRHLHPEVTLRYSGQTCFRALAPLRLPESLRQTAWEVWGGAARFGFSGVGGDTVYWFAPITAPAGTPWDQDGLKGRLLERYAAFPAIVAETIEATPAEAIMQTDLSDFPPIDTWHHRRVVLLGDAAHAMTPNLGQGGAQSLEDALALASRLHALGLTPGALAEYERARARRTRRMVRVAWHLGRMSHWENPALRWLRNAALRATPARLQQRQTEDLFTPHV
jgi:2-polyprenyl-6-methoxyphenol hydroxylase-like FAD-dependent oxidoreductase